MTTLPKTLDAGDGLTIDRDLALEATRHILIAMKLLFWQPQLLSDWVDREMAVHTVTRVLGGDDWWAIAEQLVDEVLTQEAS